MIPAEFTGGWARRGISLNGGPFTEDSVVWWLQAPHLHADLRLPLQGVGASTCFAGATSWDGNALTWTRWVDLENYEGLDTGTATWDGDDLLEAGQFDNEDGSITRYVERWRRLPHSTEVLWAGRRGATYAVRAGQYAITLADERPIGGQFLGTAWIRSADGWAVHHTLPGVGLAGAPPMDEATVTDWSSA